MRPDQCPWYDKPRMKHLLPGPLPEHARNFMRRAGYGEHMGREGQLSYTKRLGSGIYPRLHAYVEDRGGSIQVNLHLDQKSASYEGSHAHSGEYDGPLVEREMARLVAFAHQIKIEPAPPPEESQKPKRGFFGTFWQ